jgi:hypothetical protein
MAQIRGTAGYNLGHQNPFGGPGSADATSDPSPLDAIREQTSKIEDWLDTMADPVKPYVIPPTDWIQLVVAAGRYEPLPTTFLSLSCLSGVAPNSKTRDLQGMPLTRCSLLQLPSRDRPLSHRRDLH